MIDKFKEPIYIIRPVLPQLEKVYNKIKDIWDSKWLSNFGIQHAILKQRLKEYLKVKNLSLFCNGTLALYLGIQALELTGEVITTPFTFPATTNVLVQNNLKPVFCDIRLDNFNIDEWKIKHLITPKTSAILATHVFGNPCNIERIERTAQKYNLKVIYDAAHCFGVEYRGKGIGTFGDLNMFSFHATKVFHTIEGGALTYNNDELKRKVYLLKDFGINDNEVIVPGINGKMNEIQAGIGLLNLDLVDEEIKKRKKLSKIYRENLENVSFVREENYVKYNYSYFPILITNRDAIHEELKRYNVYTKRYFYPLCTNYKFIEEPKVLPAAETVVNYTLCLPLYGTLKENEVEKICELLNTLTL